MLKNVKWMHVGGLVCGLLITVITWVLAQNTSGNLALSATLLAVLSTGLTVLKTAAMLFSPSVSARAAATASAVKVAGSVIGLLVLGALLTGCLSSAPLVPVTPANQGQIQTCQNTAALHNATVITDVALGGVSAGLASAGTVVADPNARTGLAVGGIVATAMVVIGTAWAELSASNFTNSRCTDVVGALPTVKNPDETSAPAGR